MDTKEANNLLQKTLEQFRQYSFSDLQARIGNTHTARLAGESGKQYQIEIEIFWDGQAGQNIRVLAAIDDGGWRAFLPLSDGFIIAPDGSFVGE